MPALCDPAPIKTQTRNLRERKGTVSGRIKAASSLSHTTRDFIDGSLSTERLTVGLRPSAFPPWLHCLEKRQMKVNVLTLVGAKKNVFKFTKKICTILPIPSEKGESEGLKSGGCGFNFRKSPKIWKVWSYYYKKKFLCFCFFFFKPLRKTALRLASISVVCDGPVRANPRCTFLNSWASILWI